MRGERTGQLEGGDGNDDDGNDDNDDDDAIRIESNALAL